MGYHIDKMRSIRPFKIIMGLTAGVLVASLFAFLFGKLVQLLWNATIADIFSLKDITYWQGVGLLLLARVLVGGMGHGHERHYRMHKKMKDHWRKNGCKILEEQAQNDEAIRREK